MKFGAGLRSGEFVWNGADMVAMVAADPEQGVYIAPDSDPSGKSGVWVRQMDGGLMPEWFGARGDGTTDDTAAFAALAALVNFNGGGEVALRRTTYRVGGQSRNRNRYAFAPSKILEFSRCSEPLIIRGNGARLQCIDGLRFGTFHAATGAVTSHKLPYYGDDRSSPYWAMIRIDECSGAVEISDIELDGNVDRLRIGGRWGDTGYQIGAYGIALYNNRGSERLRNVYAHHHPLDGIMIDGVDIERTTGSVLENVRCEYNGRQGLSIVGGRNYAFLRCRFSHTGKAKVVSSPAAGVDIEPERGKKVRNLRFTDCLFSNNAGCGLTAEVGDAEGASFTGCTFIGTTNWAAWPRKPRFRFQRCHFVGPIVNCFGDAVNPDRATQFLACTFRDDPMLGSTSKVYLPGPIARLSHVPNVLFSRCDFRLTHHHLLPWADGGVIFYDCTMSQRSTVRAYPRGIYRGHNTIVGNVNLDGAKIVGELIVNGVRWPARRG